MARITSGKSLILSEALETAFRVDELKKYAKLLCDNVPIRKAEVVAELTMTIFRDLEKLLKKLSPLYSMILSDMLHNFRGEYRRSALAAKYESHLLKEDGTDYPLNSEIFSLFVIYEWVPVDLRDKLLKILPEPPEETIRHENDLPADLTVRETAEFALANLSTMLRLVEEKRLKVSAKTGKASVATMRNLNSVLAGGDFYEQEQGVEDIQSFAWPLLLQGGGMVKKDGAVLTLTPAGRRALKGNLAQSVETMFGKWQKYKLHDEFSRVTAVKGQKSAGGRTMTTPPKRRWVINIELSTLETGKWVAIEEFDRHIRADGLDFDMVNYNWKLYFVNKQYGAIDYCDTWKILQFRYLLIYMFEYLATLGMFDVAYENPENARRDDYYECWGADDLPYLSHCDGLRYIRLNELGAFVLGLSDEYVPKNTTEGGYEVRNTEFIFVGGGMPSPTDVIFWDSIGESSGKNCWRLSLFSLVNAVEVGMDVSGIEQQLEDRIGQPLSDELKKLFKEVRDSCTTFIFDQNCVLVTCRNLKARKMVLADPQLSKYCVAVGKTQILVPEKKKDAFVKKLYDLGYLLSL